MCFLLAAEIGGVVQYYRKSGNFFYSRKPQFDSAADARSDQDTTFFRINPIFGFMIKPGVKLRQYLPAERVRRLYEVAHDPSWLDLESNNYGFFSQFDFPYRPTDKSEFIVGVFGGSLAHWFAVQGAERLSQELSKLAVLNGRKITILNFAAGGYKQPQQLFILNYFLSLGQKFDLVINLDGFNEIALSEKNEQAGVQGIMPSVQHIGPLAALFDKSFTESRYIQALSKLLSDKEKSKKFANYSQQSKLACEYLIYDTLSTYYKNSYQANQLEIDKFIAAAPSDSILWLQPAKEQNNFENYKQGLIENWKRSSILMQQVLSARHIPYLHVLQPNQYISAKVFSSEEQVLALGPGSPYDVEHIRSGLRALALAGEALKAAGVHFLDSTSVFDQISQVTFSDNCCHLNQYGNELLAAKVAGALVDFNAVGDSTVKDN